MRRAVFVVAGALLLSVATTSAAQSAAPTFSKDVAPILYKNCVICHRPGEVAPMSLVTYQDARPWAKAMKDKVVSREMPPWGADPRYGKFRNDRSLKQQEIDTIVAWAASGALKGDDKDLPPMPQFAAGWTNGREPDAVLEMPIEVHLPAEGEIDVMNYYGTTPFKEDVFVKALDVKPGVRAVVHHAGVYLVEKLPQGAKYADGRIVGADGQFLTESEIGRANGRAEFEENTKLLSFVPGRGYEEYQAGAGQRIKANSLVRYSMHYQATGKPETDRTKIGLYIAKPGEVTHQIYHTLGDLGTPSYLIEGKELERVKRASATNDSRESLDDADAGGGLPRLPPIPPYADNWQVVSVHGVREDITIHGLTPHLHLRGKDMTYKVVYPDGREEILLSVPRYDFNWQVYYDFAEPKRLPAGSKIVVTTHFDNSLKNKYNPAPEKEVFWSEQSWDEMYAPQIRMTIDARDLRKQKNSNTQQQQ